MQDCFRRVTGAISQVKPVPKQPASDPILGALEQGDPPPGPWKQQLPFPKTSPHPTEQLPGSPSLTQPSSGQGVRHEWRLRGPLEGGDWRTASLSELSFPPSHRGGGKLDPWPRLSASEFPHRPHLGCGH